MTKQERAIYDYVRRITNKIICLKEKQIKEIIEIVYKTQEELTYNATLSKKNYVTNEYELIRKTTTTVEHFEKILSQHGDKGVHGFYRWDIYEPSGKLVKQIFSIHSYLF